MPTNPILVALDVPTEEEAVSLARSLGDHVGGFKVGLELLMGPGPGLLRQLVRLGKPVFCDAKLHDIPTTVRKAARQVGRLGVRWVTVHASGGRNQMEAAVEGLHASDPSAGVLGVTVLTSMADAELGTVGVRSGAAEQVALLAGVAAASGAEGVICSAAELQVVHDAAPALLRVTPGIRPTWAAMGDQKRVATPAEAIGAGADFLVIGRPITAAPHPVRAAERLLAELDALS